MRIDDLGPPRHQAVPEVAARKMQNISRGVRSWMSQRAGVGIITLVPSTHGTEEERWHLQSHLPIVQLPTPPVNIHIVDLPCPLEFDNVALGGKGSVRLVEGESLLDLWGRYVTRSGGLWREDPIGVGGNVSTGQAGRKPTSRVGEGRKVWNETNMRPFCDSTSQSYFIQGE